MEHPLILDENYTGPIYRFDLDKTYLRTEFETLRGLVKTAFDPPHKKRNVPGMPQLIRALQTGCPETPSCQCRGRTPPVMFITATPPQMKKKTMKKFELDGVAINHIVFKPQLKHILRGKFKQLREQIGYKFMELLRGHVTYPQGAREILFGDDAEADPFTYSLYADIVAGSLSSNEAITFLQKAGVSSDNCARIERQISAIKQRTEIHRIYINLEKATPPALFAPYTRRLVPAFNVFQMAVCLAEDECLTMDKLQELTVNFVFQELFSPHQLENSLLDIYRRKYLSGEMFHAIAFHIHREKWFEASRLPSSNLLLEKAKTVFRKKPVPAEQVPYEEILRKKVGLKGFTSGKSRVWLTNEILR